MAKKASSKIKPPRVGDRMLLWFGTKDVVAEIVEDRGPVGHGGRRLVRVHIMLDSVPEPLDFEVPAEDLRPLTSAA